jgi:hypothetical protein
MAGATSERDKSNKEDQKLAIEELKARGNDHLLPSPVKHIPPGRFVRTWCLGLDRAAAGAREEMQGANACRMAAARFVNRGRPQQRPRCDRT